MNIEINVVIWKNTGPSGAYTLHVLNTDGSNTFNYTATSSEIFVQIRQAATYYLDNIRMYRTYQDTVFVGGFDVDVAYRYGYNTQERVDEVSGKGNHYTAEFWEYSPRLGRRWNRDPKSNPSISNYAAFANNPIFYSDPYGDTLDIGNNEASKNDILSLVKEANRKYLTFENNRVGIDFGTLNTQEKADLLKSDEGLSLINDVISSDKKMLYEASELFIGYINIEEKEKIIKFMYLDDNAVVNASSFGKDSRNKNIYLPKDGYDGQVTIAPNVVFYELGKNERIVKKPRASIVFHELSENYERTHNKLNYKSAREVSNKREENFEFKSHTPGSIFYFLF